MHSDGNALPMFYATPAQGESAVHGHIPKSVTPSEHSRIRPTIGDQDASRFRRSYLTVILNSLWLSSGFGNCSGWTLVAQNDTVLMAGSARARRRRAKTVLLRSAGGREDKDESR